MSEHKTKRVDEWAELWAFWSRVLAFFFGCLVIYTTSQSGASDEIATIARYAVGVACLGPVITANVTQLVIAWRKGSDE